MPTIAKVDVDSLRSLIDRADHQRVESDAHPKSAKAAEKVKEAVGELVQSLKTLSPKERAALPLSAAEREKLQGLAGLSFVAKSDQAALFQVLGVDSLNAAAFVANDSKQGTAPRVNGGAMNPQTAAQAAPTAAKPVDGAKELAEMEKRVPAAKTEREKSDRYAEYQSLTNLLGGFADDSRIATAGALLDQAAKAKVPGFAKNLTTQKDALRKLAWEAGPEASDVQKDALFGEVLAAGMGLPNALTPAQLKKVAEIKDAGLDPAALQKTMKSADAALPGFTANIGALFQNPNDPKAQAALAKMCDVGPDSDPTAVAKRAAQAAAASLGGATAADAAAQGSLQPTAADIKGNWEKLKKGNPSLYNALDSYKRDEDLHYLKGRQTFNEIMGLLNSGMPIEMVVMLVMLLLTEREEDKFKLKVKEYTTAEQVERANSETSRKLEQPGLTEEQRETLKGTVVRPEALGLHTKSTAMLMQELQLQQQTYMQVMQALSAVIRQIQDLVMTPIRNIR